MAFSVGSSGQQTEINVTPLIDVLLVLLIIFMVIIPVTPRGLASEVPRDLNADLARTVPPLSLRISADSAGERVLYAVDGRAVERGELAAVLEASLARRSDRSVWIEASPGLTYQPVADAVGLAKAAGATAVGLARAH